MNITFTNTAWHEISGYPTGEVVSDWTRYIATEHREEAEQFWSQILESDAPQHTTEWRFANGRWVQIKIIRLDKAAPGLKGLLGSCTDITERKLHEESQVERMAEEKKRRVEAEEAKRQQELLIDITSHEIRNPISSLMQMSPSYPSVE
jgi:PAS domain S-box-containing protein